MNMTSRRLGRYTVVSVNEQRIDAAIAIHFKDRMRDIVSNVRSTVVLDLSQVQFLDSTGLGALVATMKLMPDGLPLELAGLNPAVSKVMSLTQMDSVFTIHPTLDAALADQAM
ncbi:MAG: STAS domain-containing protein [Roseivivax sp.]|nr:STAS domain-containing protein [Roseivivax sp.]